MNRLRFSKNLDISKTKIPKINHFSIEFRKMIIDFIVFCLKKNNGSLKNCEIIELVKNNFEKDITEKMIKRFIVKELKSFKPSIKRNGKYYEYAK